MEGKILVMFKIAIIGDIHLHFSEADVRYLNESDYDLVLFIGDLTNFGSGKGHKPAFLISRLTKSTLFIPGNHDTVNLLQLVSESLGFRFFAYLFGLGMVRRVKSFERRLGDVTLSGYSSHSFNKTEASFDLVAARPFSMGGPCLNFKYYLRNQYNIASMADSVKKLHRCIDATRFDRIMFLSHNGPTGLGKRRDAIFGCDFKKEEGDYGDPDLAHAIDYARNRGKQVLAVIAGHMHHELKGGGRRQWHEVRHGTHYINAARVPRIFSKDDRLIHHHVCLTLDNSEVNVREVLVEPPPV